MNPLVFMALTMFGCGMLITLIMAFTPYLTRHNEAFGVSIPTSEYHHPAIDALRRSWRNQSLLLGLVLSVVVGLLAFLPYGEIVSGCGMLLLLAGLFLLFVRFYKRMMAVKREANWEQQVTTVIAVDLSPVKPEISAAWLLLFPLVILLTAAIGFHFYPAAPEMLPMHWDIMGESGNFVPKSHGVIWFILLTQAFMAIIFSGVYWMILHSRRQLDPGSPEESARRGHIFRLAWSIFLLVFGLLMEGVFLLMLLAILCVISGLAAGIAGGVVTGLILISSVLLSVKIGQGGSRLKLPTRSAHVVSIRDDDRFWMLGSIYFNPDDPAVFVEKRFGIGWTCNFARPMSWICLIGLFVLIGGMVWFSTSLI